MKQFTRVTCAAALSFGSLFVLSLIASGRVWSAAPSPAHHSTHTAVPTAVPAAPAAAKVPAKPINAKSDSFAAEAVGLTESILLSIVLWMLLVNTPPVRRWQMYRTLSRISEALPETDFEGVVTLPQDAAFSCMLGLNGSNDFIVSNHLDLVPVRRPLYRAALTSTLWYGKILRSDAGILDYPAADSSEPVLTRQFFLLGEHSPVFKLLSLLPYGRFHQRSYEQSSDGRWYLVIVLPAFKFAGFGTLVPSRGFAIKIAPSGLPSVISLGQAARQFPHLPLFPAKLAREYAKAYANWSMGFFGRFIKRSKPLEFFDCAYESLEEARLARFVDIGDQYTVMLGPDKEHGGALNVVLLFDSRTGQNRIFKRGRDQIIFGPIEAIALVQNTHGRNHHRFAAPQLVVRGGNIYWLVVVLSALREDEGIAVLGHYLISASTGDFVHTLRNSKAVLETGVQAIVDALPLA